MRCGKCTLIRYLSQLVRLKGARTDLRDNRVTRTFHSPLLHMYDLFPGDIIENLSALCSEIGWSEELSGLMDKCENAAS